MIWGKGVGSEPGDSHINKVAIVAGALNASGNGEVGRMCHIGIRGLAVFLKGQGMDNIKGIPTQADALVQVFSTEMTRTLCLAQAEVPIQDLTAPFADSASDLAVDFLLQQRPNY